MSHPKPRMRPVRRPFDWDYYGARVQWLCVGCGCYVYRDTAEEAYSAWRSRRAQRFIEWQRQGRVSTRTPGKSFEEWPFPSKARY